MATIPVSKKHGLNPSMLKCFWCGKDKGVALLGRMKGDAKAPLSVIADYEPCPECEAIFNKGILVMGVSDTPVVKGMPAIGRNSSGKPLYPDSTYFVAQEGFVHYLYDGNPEEIQRVLKSRRMLMPTQLVRRVIADNLKEDQDDEGNQSGSQDSDTRECD